MNSPRTLPWDWYEGTVPGNVSVHETAYLESAYSFRLYRNQDEEGLTIGSGAAVYNGTMFDVGQHGKVRIGTYAVINPAWFICDELIEVGDYSLIAWNVVLMDTYRISLQPSQRRFELQQLPKRSPRRIESPSSARAIRIQQNVWIGFDSCVLPGVTIGEGSVIGARSVVASDIPPFTMAAGNPARPIRKFSQEERHHGINKN
ncbi:MAG TPA: acyltransferase [Candidatus Limnocylindrales bacterium]|jgi:acetyltransferase-like isoleucine patch superfamily enzyme|nr:acyltransferase [Candidatus Limnocylindrales bacterium]